MKINKLSLHDFSYDLVRDMYPQRHVYTLH